VCVYIYISMFDSRAKKSSRGIGKLQLNCAYYIWLCNSQRVGSTTSVCICVRVCMCVYVCMFESFRVISGEWFIHLTTERRQRYKLRIAYRKPSRYVTVIHTSVLT